MERAAQWIIPRIAWGYLTLVARTSKILWKDKEARDRLVKEHGNIIFAFWHGRQVFLPRAYRGWDAYVLVSKSKDGELIARVVEMSGMKTVRGSSSRGGLEALRGLKEKLEEGRSVGITPDGPRGPQREVHEGALYLARETGKPILPVAVSCTRKLIFRAWDDYWLPLPFNRIVVAHGTPVRVAKSDSLEEKSKELKRGLDRLTDGADRMADAMKQSAGEKLFYLLYNFSLFAFFPLILLGLYFKHPRTFTEHFWDGLGERLGRYQPLEPAEGDTVWIHAASLGECRAALPFVTALRKEIPSVRIVFSSTTINGVLEARRLGLGERVVYSPLDLPWSVAAAFKAFRPRIVLLLESEIWPNWLKAAKDFGAVAGILNGRISARSARRYGFFRWMCGPWMRKIDFVCAREAADAERFERAGIPQERISVSGNLKFDLAPLDLNGSGASMAGIQKGGPVWTAGSVREGEVSLVLDAFLEARKTVKDLRLVLAPRHLDGLNDIETRARTEKLTASRRSSGGGGPWDILIWDTFGDLLQAYRDSDLSFVGGSLVPLGGQNPIEPAGFEKPVIFGPHMENFSDPARVLLEGGGALQVQDAPGLARALVRILPDAGLKKEMGRKAKASVDAFRGRATRAALEVVLKRLGGDA
ncbi:MAG: hypothetical protein A3A86_02275 [Elusimicrobia bacterium RIFCSPLOWO2_01_FULL_60_11]|nr:MAG: hypothetical protein A3A86_02275 [Elusimicrobia bacterium RIFCSPLOWO2_01_FULL_60_11]